jgi:hypothetical protein
MKYKFLLYAFFLTGAIQLLSSCKKTYLEVVPAGIDLESNYYKNAGQVYAGLIAAYNPLGWEAGLSYCDKLGTLNSAADECYAGGGGPTDMSTWQAMNNYTLSAAVGPQQDLWNRNYTGVYRSNLILSKMGGAISGLSDAQKTRYIAEARFLRAYYYFDLVRFFGNIPLITAPIPTNDIYKVTQVKPAEIYKQIEKDLNEAIPGLPPVIPAAENGRATSGAAMALLGKAILYQNDNSRMQEAAGWLEKVNSAGVYHLMQNFADIFSPDHKFNSESVFEITHTGTQNAGWGNWPNFNGNVYVQMTGPRSYNGPTYWSAGWSFNPVISAFAEMMKSDPRYPYTVANIDSLTTATGGSYTKGYANTGYFLQKFAPMKKYVSTTGQPELNFPNDYIEIRLADTYLMEAEALVRGGGDVNKAKYYLDQVRQRAGLSSVPATLDNIYNERKLELATEGHRWFDLVRTGKAASVLAFKGFKAGINEVLPIPLNELNNTKLVQNNGYN